MKYVNGFQPPRQVRLTTEERIFILGSVSAIVVTNIFIFIIVCIGV